MAAFSEYSREGTGLTLASDLIKLLHESVENSESEEGKSQGSKGRSQGSRNKRGPISIVIPKRNIQKLPAGM